jgi:hypothetical protein
LLSLEFNDETNATKFYVNKLNIFDLINARVSTSDLTTALTYYALYSETYTKTISNNLFNGKLNNNTGTISTSIKNNGGEDVAIFHNTKNVALKGNLSVNNNLSVLGYSNLSDRIIMRSDGYNGSIRCAPNVDTGETSIVFYKYNDMRFEAAGDMWLMGQNSWFKSGYTIGTPVIGACLNIADNGNVNVINNLSVNGTTVLTNKLKIQCAGGGGNIRAVPAFDNAESSIGFYRYTDMREAEPNSMWVAGQNCWNRQGFSIGTPTRDACLNIDSSGDVLIPYNLTVAGTLNSSTNAATYTAPFNANTAQISLNGSGGNYISWSSNAVAPPSTGSRSPGTKLALYSGISGSEVDYAIGVDSNTLWASVPRPSAVHKWYCGSNAVATLTSGGLVVNNQIYKYNAIITSLNSSVTLTVSQLLGNIIICNSTRVSTLTLPTGNLTHGGMTMGTGSLLTLNQGFEWSIINNGSSVGVVIIASSSLHSYVGNTAVDIGKSARYFTKITDSINVAITYRIS